MNSNPLYKTNTKMEDIKAFNRWSVKGITVQDPGLREYINLDPKIIPKQAQDMQAQDSTSQKHLLLRD